jgi:hypothetical protein
VKWPWARRKDDRPAVTDEEWQAVQERRREAIERRKHVEQTIVPRVDEVSKRLDRLQRRNHFGPLIEKVLRGD